MTFSGGLGMECWAKWVNIVFNIMKMLSDAKKKDRFIWLTH